ncbi:MAG: leucine-rich repeat domain-containing protein, partial [Bacteroidaceae bacterium]|nr:leucine-rich repeat domain-containing protein [Bacteroidaceae bacterium]
MKRKNFIYALAALTMGLCLGSCDKDDNSPEPYYIITQDGIDFRIDVSARCATAMHASNDAATSFTIPEYVTYGDQQFMVTTVGFYAFSDNKRVESVTLPRTITVIGEGAFHKCVKLRTINIPSSVKRIEPSTFMQCESLESITLPDGLATIGDHAFYKCANLQRINIPSSVVEVDKLAFTECTKLQRVDITDVAKWCNIDFYYEGNPLTYAHNLYLGGTLLTDLKIPGSVKTIKESAFEGCTSIQSLTVEEGVEQIGLSAFKNCSNLATASLPTSLRRTSD